MKNGLSMLRVLVVIAATVAALAACGRPGGAAGGKDPNVLLLAHVDRMIAILKDDEADPPRAIRELNAYQEKNRAEIERLKQHLGELMQRDPMKAAAFSSVYGMHSAELDTRTKQMEAKAAGR